MFAQIHEEIVQFKTEKNLCMKKYKFNAYNFI